MGLKFATGYKQDIINRVGNMCLCNGVNNDHS